MRHPWVEHDTSHEQGGRQRRRVLRELKRVSTSLWIEMRAGGGSHPLQKHSRSHCVMTSIGAGEEWERWVRQRGGG